MIDKFKEKIFFNFLYWKKILFSNKNWYIIEKYFCQLISDKLHHFYYHSFLFNLQKISHSRWPTSSTSTVRRTVWPPWSRQIKATKKTIWRDGSRLSLPRVPTPEALLNPHLIHLEECPGRCRQCRVLSQAGDHPWCFLFEFVSFLISWF